MFVIEIIPLAVLPSNVPQLLSYFFNEPLIKGAVAEILIGRRKVRGIVVSSTPLEQEKHLLKKSSFQLKKLSKVISYEPQVSGVQFKIALWLSKNYYAPLGLSLKTVLSSKSSLGLRKSNSDLRGPNGLSPTLIISSAKKGLRTISQHIKEIDGQCLVIVPEKTLLNYFIAELKPKFDSDKLILGTRKTLFSNFKNLKLIIVEDPMNEAYKSEMTPKYNTPDLAEEIARLHGADILYISPMFGLKNHLNPKNKYGDGQPEIKIINMVNEIRTDNPNILSKELKEAIIRTLNKNKRILIFSPRKGFAGLLICQNCGISVKCPNCSAPLKVHKSTDLNLKCHRCTHTQQLPKFCSNCNSYKLKTAGPAGTQKIYDRVREILAHNNINAPVLILDSDVTKNETEEREIIDEINKPKPAVIIATQMIFSYRYELVFPVVGVVNTDSLITIPDYDVEERLLYQLKKLMDFNPDKLILQTYNPDNQILKCIASGNFEQFYNNELEMRKLLGYPPFARLIKLTYRDKDQKRAFVAARMLVEKLRMAIAQFQLEDKIKISDSTPGFVEKEKGLYNYNIILKSLTGETPREILKFIPVGWSIDVDPRSTL